MSEQRKMMEAVYTNGFAADEARLFLDTHPDDKEALAYYQKKMNMFHQAVQRYEEKFGPILPESAGRYVRHVGLSKTTAVSGRH